VQQPLPLIGSASCLILFSTTSLPHPPSGCRPAHSHDSAKRQTLQQQLKRVANSASTSDRPGRMGKALQKVPDVLSALITLPQITPLAIAIGHN